jgi:type II secretory pathway predicted ATPase ExeA
MYEAHFGLRQRPFPATPDALFYYPATNHEQALRRLTQALEEGEGLVLLTGVPGTGKTLLCHRLIERLDEGTAWVFLTNSHLNSRKELLQAILFDLSLSHDGQAEQDLRLRLTEFLLKKYGDGKRTVLVVDEAQHLSPDLLEELRLLGNLEAGRRKALQVVLSAQIQFLETLRLPELASFNQRLAVRARLDVLDGEESIDYVLHQVRTAGGDPDAVFDREALEVLARETLGVPRVISQTAHQALVLAHLGEAEVVDVEAVLEALADLGLVEPTGAVEFIPDGSLPAGDTVPGLDGSRETMVLSDDDVREEPPKVWPNEPTPICRLFDGKRRENGNGQNN